MIRSLITFYLLLLTCSALAQPPAGRAWVMTDGVAAFPSNSVATPAQLAQVEAALAPLSEACADSRVRATNAAAVASAAYDAIRFADAPSIVTSTAYIQSVGAQASAGTNQVIHIHSFRADGVPVTNLHLVATFDKLQTVAPSVDFRYALTQGGTNTVWASVTNAACSWPATVADNTVTNGAYVYLFDIPASAGATAFFRIVSRDDGGSGSGFYFLVYNFISVNGRVGRTADIEGVGHYEGGILAAPLED